MKVLVVASWPEEERPPTGGVQAATTSLVQGLAEVPNVRVHVLDVVSGSSGQTALGVTRIPVPRTTLLQQFLSPWVAAKFVNATEPDVVHVQGDAFLALFLQLTTPIPVALTIHGYSEIDALRSGRRDRWVRAAYHALRDVPARRLVRNIIAISRGVERRAAPWQRVTYIPNAVSSEISALVQATRGEEKQTSQTVVFIGRVVNLKNVRMLISSFGLVKAAFPTARLRLIGPQPDQEYLRACVTDVERLGLTNEVELTGPLPAAGVALELVRASAVILPSSQEHAPLVVSEAMALGVPVVAADVGAVREMTSRYPLAFLVDANVESLAGGIARVLEKESGSLLRVDSETSGSYDCRQVAERTVDFYRAISPVPKPANSYMEWGAQC